MKSAKTGIVLFVTLTMVAMGLGWNSFYYLRETSELSANPNSLNNQNSQKTHLAAIEKILQSYADVKSVELEATVEVNIFKSENETINGSGQFFYVADGNRYKYGSRLSDNLVAEGLMRNLDVAFDGSRFYMLDHQSKILSFQPQEEIRSPVALPNPFFLPLDFLSVNDDDCVNCRLRLQDVKALSPRLTDRLKSISELRSLSNEVGVVSDVRLSGGKINKTPYNNVITLAGEKKDKANISSVMRTDDSGKHLVLSIMTDHRDTAGFNGKIPYVIETVAYDATGRVNFRLLYSITELKINQPVADEQTGFSPGEYEKIWDSQKYKLVDKLPRGRLKGN